MSRDDELVAEFALVEVAVNENETPGTSAVKTTVVPDILAVTGLSLFPVAVLI